MTKLVRAIGSFYSFRSKLFAKDISGVK